MIKNQTIYNTSSAMFIKTIVVPQTKVQISRTKTSN